MPIDYGEFAEFATKPTVGSAAGADARGFAPAPAEGVADIALPSQGPKSYWTDPIPSVMGVAGGMGGAALTGGNPFGAVAGASAAQGTGEVLRQRLNTWMGYPVPASGEDAMRQIRDEAVLGGATEIGGQAIGGLVAGPIGRRMMQGALRDPIAAETAMELRGSVGKRFGRQGTALPRAKQQMDVAANDLERLLSAAETAGAKANPRDFERVLMNRVARAKVNSAGQPGALRYWQGRLSAWRQQYNLHPTNPNANIVQVRDPATGRIVKTLHRQDIGIRDLNTLKQENATLEAQFREARKQTGGNKRTSLEEQYAADLAAWARQKERELVPGNGGRGLEEANARYARYKRLHDVVSDIENPAPGKAQGRAPGLAFMGTTIPQLSAPTSSRVGLALTSPMAGLIARTGMAATGRALRGPGSFYGVEQPYAYPSPGGNLSPGSPVNIPERRK